MMNERIDLIIDKYCEGKKYIFAEKCDVTPQTISVWYKNGFNDEAINRIRKAFPQVNINWVETGDGEIEQLSQQALAEIAVNTELAELKEQIEMLKATIAEKDRHINALLSVLANNTNNI